MLKKQRWFSYICIMLVCCLFMTGCSVSDAFNSFGDMLGLNMSSSSDDSDQSTEIKADIEIIDSHSSNEPTPVAETEDSFADSEEVPEDEPEDEYIWDHENKIYTKEAASPDKITISFAGDICFTEGCSVLNHIKKHDNDFSTSFDEKLLSRMVDSDIFMLNNEFPYSTGGAPIPNKDYTFRANPEDAKLLFDVGTDLVSLANNHAFDFGPEALDDTFKTLRDIDMPYIGAGENITEAVKPAYFKINGKVISFIAATQIEGSVNPPHTREATDTENGVFRCLDTTRLKAAVAEAKENSDYVICFIHWGTEKTDVIRDWQISASRDMADSGADLIIGAHPHVLQGIDYINGVPVFYSLGNYLFNSNTQDTCLVTLTLDSSQADGVSVESLQFVPCIQSGGMTVEADAENKARIIGYEQGISFHANIDADGYVTYSEQNRNIQNGQNTSPYRKKDDEKN